MFARPSASQRPRCPMLLVRCSAKGFGAAQPSKSGGKGDKKINRGDKKAVDRAVRLVEERERKARPVDSREAAKGRVEFVKVKDWGSGQPADLGQLQVAASSAVQLGGTVPLYEQLAKRLELLEAQGAMPVAQPRGGKPLPPFKRWAFAEAHYRQYLSDLLSVHSALEAALASCSAAPAGGDTALLPEHLRKALSLLRPEQGLARSQQLAADLKQLQASAEAADSSSGGGGGESGEVPALPNAAGLAQFLTGLAARYGAAEGEEEAVAAVLKLLAHAYVLLLVLLTSGGRVGAASAEKLNLFARGALNTYRTYPDHVGDPIEALKSVVNEWGTLLPEAEQEQMMEELPSAMQKASLLLTPLAQE